jgi:hypothetical protein
MAATNLNINHQSIQQTLPSLRNKTVNTFKWGNGGNSVTITDTYCSTNSQIEAWVTGTVPQSGQWAYQVNEGSFTITSSSSESSTLPVSYIIF